MRSTTAAVVLGCVLLSGCGKGSSPAKTTPAATGTNAAAAGQTDDLPGLTQQIVTVLKTIKDEASAKAAAPKLEELAGKVDAIQEQTKAGTAPPVANPEDFAKRQMAAMQDYGKELARIGEIPGAAEHLQGMMSKFAP
jgi:hypothetical protein